MVKRSGFWSLYIRGMNLADRYLTRTDFSSQEEFRPHFPIRVPEHFNVMTPATRLTIADTERTVAPGANRP